METLHQSAMKKTIAIVAGGDSSELPVSLRSAQGIYSFLDKDKYAPYIVEIKGLVWEVRLMDGTLVPLSREDFSFSCNGEKVKFDYAYITIHGTPGENGLLQGYLDLLRIPYSSCGVLASALTFDKFTCNHYLAAFGVRIADSILLREGQTIADTEIVEKLGLPCFVKPNAGGSSFGVSKVKTVEELQPAINKARRESPEVLIEQILVGTEVSCGIYKIHTERVVLPVTEVVPDTEFFDYEAKYNGKVQEITPARISDDTTARIHALNTAIYDILGARGIIRIDYIIAPNGAINLLEVNTTPGMTETSFIPQQVKAAGRYMTDVLTQIIEDTLPS
jgi:D-alanine-D-alanine ligase